jgi:hypothetical protein
MKGPVFEIKKLNFIMFVLLCVNMLVTIRAHLEIPDESK